MRTACSSWQKIRIGPIYMRGVVCAKGGATQTEPHSTTQKILVTSRSPVLGRPWCAPPWKASGSAVIVRRLCDATQTTADQRDDEKPFTRDSRRCEPFSRADAANNKPRVRARSRASRGCSGPRLGLGRGVASSLARRAACGVRRAVRRVCSGRPAVRSVARAFFVLRVACRVVCARRGRFVSAARALPRVP